MEISHRSNVCTIRASPFMISVCKIPTEVIRNHATIDLRRMIHDENKPATNTHILTRKRTNLQWSPPCAALTHLYKRAFLHRQDQDTQ